MGDRGDRGERGDRGDREARSEPHVPKLIAGKYQVGGIIGKGGFGHVYKAIDQESAEFVAIKQMRDNVLSPGDLGSIELEIQLLSKLKHQNIVKYIASFQTENHLNIVLELVEGGSLSSIIKKFGVFQERICAKFTRQILCGLAYLHSQGVIHRDIKGANVLCTKRGHVKLADFGVATKLSEVDNSKGLMVGTSYWMAPEIVEMNAPTPACDLWSVGSTVVEIYSGSPPYFGLGQYPAMFRIVSDVHPPLPECISPALESFLLACWEKNPSLRAGANELLATEWIQVHKSLDQKQVIKKSPVQRSIEPDMEEDEDEEDVADAEVETFLATVAHSKPVPPKKAGGDRRGGSGSLPQGRGAAPGLAVVPSRSGESDGDGDGEAAEAEAEAGAARAAGALTLPSRLSERGKAAARRLAVASGKDAAAAPEMLGAVRRAASENLTASPDSPSRPAPAAGTQPSPTSAIAERADEEDPAGEYHFFFVEEAQRMDQKRLGGALPNGEASPCHTEEPSLAMAERGSQHSPVGRRAESPVRTTFRRGSDEDMWVQNGLQLPPHLGSMPLGTSTSGHSAQARQQDAAEIKQLLAQIRPFEEPETLVQICQRLTELLQQEGNMHILLQHGAVPIAEMLHVADPALLREVLKIANQLAKGSEEAQEIFATVGLIPGVIKFARSQDLPHLRREAATFISRLCKTSERSLHLLVACGGLEALVGLVAHDYYNNRDLVWLALDSLDRIFQSASENGRNNDFCRILAKHGLCGHLCTLIDTLASDILVEKAQGYLRVVVGLLLHFAKEGDAIVKVSMTKGVVLEGLLSSLEFLSPELAVQIYKVFKWLAQEPSVLNMLENAGVVPALVANLAALSNPEMTNQASMPRSGDDGHAASQDCTSQCLLSLFYLCKLSRPRQEQAALAGAVPVFQALVERDHLLKVYAFVMLCDMTSASLATRRILWSQGGVELLVRCLREPQLETFALEALVGWAGIKEHRADWCFRLEGVLLGEGGGGDFVTQLLALFGVPHSEVFMKVLEQLLKLTRLSRLLSNALAGSAEFFQVIAQRLQPSAQPRATTPRPSGDGEDLTTMGATASPGAPPSAAAALRSDRSGGRPAALTGHSALGLLPSQGSEAVLNIPDDDAVGARKNLLRLLLQICQGQDLPQLATLAKKHDLAALLVNVVIEEQQKKRMILCELAKQLLDLLRQALSTEASA